MHQRETVVLLIHLIALAACGLENVDPGTPPANSTAKLTQSIDAGVVVTDDGSPLGGAMITLVADGRRTTVFSGDDGIFGGLDRMGSVESVQVR
jgi:hypothetical protein